MKTSRRKPVVLLPGQGRSYPMGRISALFKADGDETKKKYSVSEWWLDANTKGPGAHSHEEDDDLFYVIEGTMTFLIGERWVEAPQGSFIQAPAGITHDFENRSTKRAGLLNFYAGGEFETDMPSIVKWYEENPAQPIRPE